VTFNNQVRVREYGDEAEANKRRENFETPSKNLYNQYSNINRESPSPLKDDSAFNRLNQSSINKALYKESP
jgi:hypothetical protein